MGPDFKRLLDSDAPRTHLFAALRDILAASTHVLVIEDLHWADDATLDLMRYLGRRIDSTRSLLARHLPRRRSAPRTSAAAAAR